MKLQHLLIVGLGILPATSDAIEFEKLSHGTWAAVQPSERKFNDCNSLIVAGDKFVIVVDAQESAADVNQIIDFINAEIGKPLRYLINTHWHGDHTQGNTLYRDRYGDDLIIVGHRTHTEDILGRAAASHKTRVEDTQNILPAAREQLVTGLKQDGSRFTPDELAAQTRRVENAAAWLVANQDVTFTGPSLTIDEVYSVEAGAASFTVYPMRGHTRGDLVIHFPELDIVAAGDLLDAMPYAGHGFPTEWLVALSAIRDLGDKIYLPGHGPVIHDDTLITNLSFYFQSLTSQVKVLAAAGNSPEEILGMVDLTTSRELLAGDDAAAQRFFDQVQQEAVQRAIGESNGAVQ